MIFFYTFFISFILVFISELGDKTQLLVLSFSTKVKASVILLGVAFGSFLSHGVAILFGSTLTSFGNDSFHFLLELLTYFSFIAFGILAFIPSKENEVNKVSPLKKFSKMGSYFLMIASSIAIGELGDKTFLASLGLGISYPDDKIPLILGAILGMVVSDSIAIFLGKFLGNKISERKMQMLSGILFLLFGFLGLFSILH